MFPYKPLKERQIRLISFMNDSGLNCTIDTYTLTSDLNYVALSYTWRTASHQRWRSETDIYQITLNNLVVNVQQNLHDALLNLGKFVRRKNTKLWVDFLCIDQENLPERSDQVRLMTELYAKAAAIYSWLGLPDDESEARLGVELMETLNTHWGQLKNSFDGDVTEAWARITPDTPGFPTPSEPENSKAWEGIAAMMLKAYWERTWVYQEATAPGEIWFCYGTHVFSDEELSTAVFIGSVFGELPGFPHRIAKITGSQGNAFRLNAARIARGKGKGMDLLSLMRDMRNTCCSDPRDKVFAAMGLANDVSEGEEGVHLTVDYTRGLEEVYIDLMRFTFERTGIEFLDYVVLPAPDSQLEYFRKVQEPAMPSWVVDWRFEFGMTGFDPGAGKAERWLPLYNACVGADDTGAVREIEGKALLISGSIIDEVNMMTLIWDDSQVSHTIVKSWKELLRETQPDLSDQTFDSLVVADGVQVDAAYNSQYLRGGSIDWRLMESLSSDLDAEQRRKVNLMTYRLHGVCRVRRAGITSHGRAAILPAAAAKGDRIAAFFGGQCLYVIRPDRDQQDCWQFVGSCYMDGMMDGQAIDKDSPRWKQIFRLT